jgi:hypothetical protein
VLQPQFLDLLLSLSELLQEQKWAESELEETGCDWSLLKRVQETEQQLRDRAGGLGLEAKIHPTPN